MDKEKPKTKNLSAMIEAVLFYTGEDSTTTELAKLFECEEDEIYEAIEELKNLLEGRGVVVGVQGKRVYMGTYPEAHPYIEKVSTKELEGDLTEPLLETLTVILYQAPVSKTHIDYIRGVNTNTALRHLMARGLIERRQKSSQNLYTPTQQSLRLIGVKDNKDLPDFEEVRQRLSNALAGFEDPTIT